MDYTVSIGDESFEITIEESKEGLQVSLGKRRLSVDRSQAMASSPINTNTPTVISVFLYACITTPYRKNEVRI